MTQVNTAAGFFGTKEELEEALWRLQARDVSSIHLSIAGRSEPREGLIEAVGRRRVELDSPRCGAFWVSGVLADSIEAGLRRTQHCGCESELTHGLRRAGVPAHNVREYEDALAYGDTLLFVHGSQDEIARTVDVLCDGARAVRLHTAFRWDA